MNVSDATERQELNVNYVNREPEFERARGVIDANNEALEVEAQGLLDNLSAHDVLYYPMADLDSAPVGRGGHLADVFMVCDWRWPLCPADRFDVMVDELTNDGGEQDGPATSGHESGHRSFEVPAEQVRAITGVSADFGLFHDEPAWLAGRAPWGRVARLKRRGNERAVWLIYVTGNAVEVYKNLFVERDAAPKTLWLDCPLGADLDGWAEFISPGGEFGRVFTTAAHQPDYVVAQRRHPGWRHNVVCGRLPTWHPAWSLSLFGVPGSRPI